MQRHDVVIVGQRGMRVDDPVKYGAARALLELARNLAAHGRSPLLVGLSSSERGTTEGIPFAGAADEDGVRRRVRALGHVQALIACSRADVFVDTPADVRILYQHGPHVPEGDFAVEVVRRLGIPVVLVSEDSRRFQESIGIPPSQLHVVHNGYDSRVFRPDDAEPRHRHRLVFAGLCVPYKGLDIAVAAFAMLKPQFPDAEFHIHGDTVGWDAFRAGHHWRREWLDAAHRPDWAAIESALPGVSYRGAVDAAALARAFRQASLLVMPSRVHETFGLVSVEAQACGCLPVLPAQGGFPETMRPGRTGFLYEANTPSALASAVAALWNAGLPTDAQRAEAAEWVAGCFSWATAGAKFLELLDDRPKPSPLWAVESRAWRTAMMMKDGLRRMRDRLRPTLPSA